jgi:putative transcription factor
MSEGQDWKPQSFNFGPKGGANANQPKKVNETGANKVLQSGGSVSVTKKEHHQSNNNGGLGSAAKRLDDDNESTKVKKVDFGVKINIMKGRQAKGINQQELARLIQEKASVVGDYENGRGVPNEKILQKMEKALGIYLRGARAGQTMDSGKKPAPKPAPKK